MGNDCLWPLLHSLLANLQKSQYNLSTGSNQNVESKRKSVESKNTKRGVQNTNSYLFRVTSIHCFACWDRAQWIELSSKYSTCNSIMSSNKF